MNFEVHGQEYLLSFHPREERWYLLVRGLNGIKPVPVIDDEAPGAPVHIVVPLDSEGPTRIN
jgi:hypothetical protein